MGAFQSTPRLLIGCERSGVVREAFRARGWDAWSCDLEPADDGSRFHIQGDVFDALFDEHWDMLIAHPPCTYLTSSAEWAYTDGPYHQQIKKGTLVGAARRRAREQALKFFRELLEYPVAHVAIENPVGAASTRIRPADQYVQPYEFGDDASKRTGLWLRNLPRLQADPRRRLAGRRVRGPRGTMVERWANQTDSGQNRLPPTADRATDRSRTYPGIAEAMAEQWGPYVEQALR